MTTRSEQLFKSHSSVIETSAIMNPQASQLENEQPASLLKNTELHCWYRLFSFNWWQSLGISVIETQQIMSQIAMSHRSRTSALLDTVKGYQPGSWCYEWLSYAVGLQREKPSYRAVTAATIASYPHLKGDELSDRAQVLVDRYYQQVIQQSSQVDHFEKIIVDGTQGEASAGGYLHVPSSDTAVPLIIVACDFSMLYSELLGWFENQLAAAGIGLFVIDFAGNGLNRRWGWQEDSSRLYELLWQKLQENPRIDSKRVGLVGVRWAAHSMIRLAQLHANELKYLVCIGPAVDSIFQSQQRLDALPRVVVDGVLNRLGSMGVERDRLAAHLSAFSLKKQGMLRRHSWNGQLYCIYHDRDIICEKDDIESLKQMAVHHDFERLKGVSIEEQLPKIFIKCGNWLKKQLSYE
ncbi:alpha/beta hydrolase [Celerinatantimonas sp. YJH-8]|uniref:alpha/beta hydrolase n=1 Tax=Celerinatantimonas sp. YJH-8 TaxID=3228714 RepID=UPI0038C58469